MQHKCSACEDTGNLSKHLAGNLDCTSCSAATDRAELEKWLYKNTAIGDQDSAWLIHQRALAMAPKQEASEESLPEMTDDRIFEWAEGYVFTLKGMPHKMTFSRPRFVEAVRIIIAHLPIAAPAAANGAMPDLPEIKMDHLNVLAQHYTADQMHAYGKACAAAGPDAALVKALEGLANLYDTDEGCRSTPEYIAARAALSGAKGN